MPTKINENNPLLLQMQRDLAALRATLIPQTAPAGARIAQGSSDAHPVYTLEESVTALLRARCLTTEEISAETGVDAGALLKKLRAMPGIVNAGSSLRPVWSALLGDDGATFELIDKVERLISIRPMLATEIETLTGARRNRVRGALCKVQLRRKVENHGDDRRALWYLPPKTKR